MFGNASKQNLLCVALLLLGKESLAPSPSEHSDFWHHRPPSPAFVHSRATAASCRTFGKRGYSNIQHRWVCSCGETRRRCDVCHQTSCETNLLNRSVWCYQLGSQIGCPASQRPYKLAKSYLWIFKEMYAEKRWKWRNMATSARRHMCFWLNGLLEPCVGIRNHLITHGFDIDGTRVLMCAAMHNRMMRSNTCRAWWSNRFLHRMMHMMMAQTVSKGRFGS